MTLTNFERETIVNFNEAEPTAYIFTYNTAWQRHLEDRLGLKPVKDNGFGGREYELPKKMIKPPRPLMKLSPEARKKLSLRAKGLHQKPVLSAGNMTIAMKSRDES